MRRDEISNLASGIDGRLTPSEAALLSFDRSVDSITYAGKVEWNSSLERAGNRFRLGVKYIYEATDTVWPLKIMRRLVGR